jgi:phage protein D
MPASYQILLGGAPAGADFLASLASLEVEENLEMPSAFQMRLPVGRDDSGNLTEVGDSRFAPFSNVAVVVTPDGQTPQCIFDGYVLSHKVHLEPGANGSTVEVWGEDASWLMNLEQKVKEWTDVTDAAVAATIFGDYDIAPGSANFDDDSPAHVEAKHTLMQRATDIQFLRMLARRNGKLCWVACTALPGVRTGYFVKPAVDGAETATLSLQGENGNVDALDFEWEANRPSVVVAHQKLFDSADENGVGGETTDSGLPPLADRDLAAFAGRTMSVVLTTTVDDAGELTSRAQSLLREAGWFVRCRGQAELARVNAVLRPGTVVRVNGAGTLHSGKYFVWSVRHSISLTSHRMSFRLVRNAVGAAS